MFRTLSEGYLGELTASCCVAIITVRCWLQRTNQRCGVPWGSRTACGLGLDGDSLPRHTYNSSSVLAHDRPAATALRHGELTFEMMITIHRCHCETYTSTFGRMFRDTNAPIETLCKTPKQWKAIYRPASHYHSSICLLKASRRISVYHISS